MSERKVLNKYYPPDYDPSKIPKLKRAKDRQYVIRVMAPFNMRCKTCGNYIYKGTKFNARMETVQDKDYLGLRIYRFYIKCTRCVAEITFKTDPENQDYSVEHGATRNFEAEKLIEQQEKRLQEKREEEESNPMKMLEIRTRDSKREMEMMESLEELRELNQRHAGINYEGMLQKRQETEEERIAREKDEEDDEIRKIFNKDLVRRLVDESSEEEDEPVAETTSRKRPHPTTDILTQESQPSTSVVAQSSTSTASKPARMTAAMLGIVRKKKRVGADASGSAAGSETNNAPVISNDQKVKTEPCTSKANGAASGAGLTLLTGYGSSSDSADSE